MKEKAAQLEIWMRANECEDMEFKEAKNRYDFEELVGYCVALANEGGGKMILGITDKPPRQVVGTGAFQNIERTKQGLIERIHLRVDAEEILHPAGRVLVFHVPSRPIGMPIHYNGRYFMRAGDSLAPMLPDMLKRIFDEAEPDFTAEICTRATLDDLDRETNKALLLKHITDCGTEGCRFRELKEVLPALSVNQIKSLLKELSVEGQVHCRGKTRSGLWHPG